MLRALDVSNLVLIEKASLELGEGFTCLTGETGAGKSMLVDAIELLVGGRGDAGLVREGAERAELSAEFEVKEKTPLADWLVEADLAGDPGTLILRRSHDRRRATRRPWRTTRCVGAW
jgi:DNA repair protein RecN (Recombination protein N)